MMRMHVNCISSMFLLPLISLLLLQAIIIALGAAYDLETDKQALLDFVNNLQEFPHGRLGWTSTEAGAADPICTSWVGVTCNPDRTRVVELRLPDFGLRGTILVNTAIGRLDALEKLDLRNNSLFEVIPPNLTFPRLRHLNLSGNRFSGLIPPSLRGFPPSSFAGNPLLCGPPLEHQCGGPDLDLIPTSFVSRSDGSSASHRRSLKPAGRAGKTKGKGKGSKKTKRTIIVFVSIICGGGALGCGLGIAICCFCPQVFFWCFCCRKKNETHPEGLRTRPDSY